MKRPALTTVVRRGLGSLVARSGAHLNEEERRAIEWANHMKGITNLRGAASKKRKKRSKGS